MTNKNNKCCECGEYNITNMIMVHRKIEKLLDNQGSNIEKEVFSYRFLNDMGSITLIVFLSK